MGCLFHILPPKVLMNHKKGVRTICESNVIDNHYERMLSGHIKVTAHRTENDSDSFLMFETEKFQHEDGTGHLMLHP